MTVPTEFLSPYQVQSHLLEACRDEGLDDSMRLADRMRLLEIIDLAEEMAEERRWGEMLAELPLDALRSRMVAANDDLFAEARSLLTEAPSLAERRRYVDQFTDYRPGVGEGYYYGADALDHLVDGVMGLHEHGVDQAPSRDPDMVHYVPTPARVILDMLDHVPPEPGEFFIDLGSGLGRAVILFHLLTGLSAQGVEIEEPYRHAADRAARSLGLEGVSFVRADAREADLSAGNRFYLFTPFVEGLLAAVLERLYRVAEDHPILLCTYGTVTQDIAHEPWVRIVDPNRLHAFKLACFRSLL
jgi:hypothetical protein